MRLGGDPVDDARRTFAFASAGVQTEAGLDVASSRTGARAATALGPGGFSRSRLYALVRADAFPVPRLIEGRSLWVESKVQAWIRARIEAAPVVGTMAGRAEAEKKKAA